MATKDNRQLPDAGTAAPDTTPASASAASPVAGTAMRERILDAALDRFTTQGYAGTSLREIAEDLGVSKAALYYHFPSKQDILLALHLRVHGLTSQIAPFLGETPDDETWNGLLGALIGVAISHRRLMALHFREQDAIGALHKPGIVERHGDQNTGVEDQLIVLMADRSVPAETRIRRVASLGTVIGSLIGAAALSDIPDDELERTLRQIAREVMRPTE